jgi:hypothetical protein
MEIWKKKFAYRYTWFHLQKDREKFENWRKPSMSWNNIHEHGLINLAKLLSILGTNKVISKIL